MAGGHIYPYSDILFVMNAKKLTEEEIVRLGSSPAPEEVTAVGDSLLLAEEKQRAQIDAKATKKATPFDLAEALWRSRVDSAPPRHESGTRPALRVPAPETSYATAPDGAVEVVAPVDASVVIAPTPPAAPTPTTQTPWRSRAVDAVLFVVLVASLIGATLFAR